MTAAEFKRIRLKRELTHMQLAYIFGHVSNASVSRWENGERKIPVYVANFMRTIDKRGVPAEWKLDNP